VTPLARDRLSCFQLSMGLAAADAQLFSRVPAFESRNERVAANEVEFHATVKVL
jgi:hypothetical protein